MKILEQFQTITNAHGVPMDKILISYAPREGLVAWWAKSNTSHGFKWPEFIMEILQLENKPKGQEWWIKDVYFDALDWGCTFIRDPEEVDLGPFPFRKTVKDFLTFYTPLWEMEHNRATKENVNRVGVDYEYIKSDQVNVEQKYVPKTQWQEPKLDSFQALMDPEFPITFVVNGNHFKSLRDVDKFVTYNKMRHLMFDRHPFQIYDDAQFEIIKRIVNNKEQFIQFLRSL